MDCRVDFRFCHLDKSFFYIKVDYSIPSIMRVWGCDVWDRQSWTADCRVDFKFHDLDKSFATQKLIHLSASSRQVPVLRCLG